MKIGLYNLEPHIINAALMKISRYHKDKGDSVELYNALFHNEYDKIYASSILKNSDKSYVRKNMIIGGPGFNTTNVLPIDIESADYDYSLFPKCDYSMLWFSKGCIRRCPFCIVPKTEGNIHALKPKNLNPKGTHIKVMDNNFFANSEWKNAISYLKKQNQPLDFQGIDVRILTNEMCHILNKFKHHKQIHIAWDNPRDNTLKHIKNMIKIIKPYKIMVYVLIGYWSDESEDLCRVLILRQLGLDPFVMPFNQQDNYQKNFSRWVNNKAVFNSTSWQDYKRSKKQD